MFSFTTIQLVLVCFVPVFSFLAVDFGVTDTGFYAQ